MLIKEGNPSWRFEHGDGRRFVSAGSKHCTEDEARAEVERLAAEHGCAKASNGSTEIVRRAAGLSRKVQLG